MISVQGQCLFEAGEVVGWDKWRFATPAHQHFSTFAFGGPVLEASWSPPYVSIDVTVDAFRFSVPVEIPAVINWVKPSNNLRPSAGTR